MKLDKFDIAILLALQRDARMSLQDLSSNVGLTSSPCWARIKRMEEAGVIEGYSVRVNLAKLGLPDSVIVQLTLDNHADIALPEFERALEAIPEVLEAYLVSGDCDYIVRIAVTDTGDYERLLREQLLKIPGIRHNKSSFVLKSIKHSQLPLRR